MERDSFILYLLGFTGTIITTVYLITKVLANKNPVIEILKSYKKNPMFSKLKFEIDENNAVIGEINDFGIELTPISKDTNIYFLLIIDLLKKPYYNNHSNLKNAFGKYKFEQTETKVILHKWEPAILNYGNFNKVIDKLVNHLNKIDNKTSLKSIV